MKVKKKSTVLLIFLLLIKFIACNAQISIIVNKGSFASVSQASAGEDMVNFFDGDPTDDRACTESFAATELAKFLPEATSVKQHEIKFIDPNVLPRSGNVFIIGSRFSNSLIKKYDLPGGTKLDNEQSYNIRSFKDNGRIIIIIIEGSDRVGTLYGVYRYLQELGIKFIGLGEKGTIFPDSLVDIPSDLNITENPSYLTRGFHTWNTRKTGREFFIWMARNKFNYWAGQDQPIKFLKKLGVKLSDGGHRIQGIVFNSGDEYPYNHPVFKGDENKPDDPYKVGNDYTGDTNNDGKLSNFEAHPEWYGMKDGKRIKIIFSPEKSSPMGTNFCTSNEDARKEFAKRIAGQFISGGQWEYIDDFMFVMFDGGEKWWCTCDNCKKAGSYTDKMFIVVYDVLKELERIRQSGKLNHRVEVCCSAYAATQSPPTVPLPADFDYDNTSVTFAPYGRCYVHSFADPACTEINQKQFKAYLGWTTGDRRYYKGPIFIDEYYNISYFYSLPVVFTRIMAVDIPWYYRNGARQFKYMHTPDKMWGTWTLNQYLMGQLLWNINVDVSRVLNNYFNLYYPSTSYSTRKFYEQLEIATANIRLYKSPGYPGKSNLFRFDHMHYDEYHPLLNDGPDVLEMMDAMELAKKYLDKSLLDCKNAVELNRLLEDKDRFGYGYAMYRYIYHMIRTSIFNQKGDKVMATREFTMVEDYAEQLKKMVDIVKVASDADKKNGFEATRSVELFDEFKKLYGK